MLNPRLFVVFSIFFVVTKSESSAEAVSAEKAFAGIVPLHYDLYFDLLSPKAYRGTVELLFNPAANLSSLELNANNLFGMRIVRTDLRAIDAEEIGISTWNHVSDDVIRANVCRPLLPIMSYALKMDFEGQPQNTAGGLTFTMFNSSFYDTTGLLWSAKPYVFSTVFQMRYARSVFPCLDTPSLKSTFSLCLTHESSAVAVSNTRVISVSQRGTKRTKTCFGQTMKLPTYLVAFAVMNQFQKKSLYYKNINGDIATTSVYDHSDMLYSNKTFVDMINRIPSLIQLAESYFERPIPGEKLDFIMHPVYMFGLPISMENHGVVSMTEEDRPYLAVYGHEVIHHFIGNFVTVADFGDIDLQEGLTGYLSDKLMSMLTGSRVLSNRRYAKQLYWGFRNGADFSSGGRKFSDMRDLLKRGYLKPPYLFHMLDDLIGVNTLRKVILRYVSSNAGGFSSWETFDATLANTAGQTAASFLRRWRSSAGYPVVTVTQLCNRSCEYSINQFSSADSEMKENIANSFPMNMEIVEYKGTNLLIKRRLVTDFPLYLSRRNASLMMLNPTVPYLQLVLYEMELYAEIFRAILSRRLPYLSNDWVIPFVDQFCLGVATSRLPFEATSDVGLLAEVARASCEIAKRHGEHPDDLASCGCQILTGSGENRPHFSSRYVQIMLNSVVNNTLLYGA